MVPTLETAGLLGHADRLRAPVVTLAKAVGAGGMG